MLMYSVIQLFSTYGKECESKRNVWGDMMIKIITDRKSMIEALLGDALYLENRIADMHPLNNYDLTILFEITQDIYQAVKMLEMIEGEKTGGNT